MNEARWRSWMAHTDLDVPLPDGDPEGWTDLLSIWGPARFLARTPAGLDVCDERLMRSAQEVCGRPTSDEESVWLWAVTPLPADAPDRLWRGLLAHPDFWVRHAATFLIDDPERAPALQALLHDDDNDVRRGAAWALGRLGRGAEALLARLDDPDVHVTAARLEAAARVGAELRGVQAEGVAGALVAAVAAAAEGAPEALLDAICEGDVAFRDAACAWWCRLPGVARGADRVVEAFEAAPSLDGCPGWIALLGACGEEVVEPLQRWAEAEDWRLRAAAARVSASLGPAAHQLEGVLRALVRDDDADVQREAALALLTLEPRDREPLLGRLLRVLDRSTLARAAELGVSLGPADALVGRGPVGPGLLAVVLGHGDLTVRGVAALLLGRHLPDTFGALFASMARDEGRNVLLEMRTACSAATVWGSRPPAGGVVHRLLLAGAHRAGRPSGRVGELVLAATHDGDAAVRRSALRLLREVDVAPYLPSLAWVARHDPDEDVRRAGAAFVEPTFPEGSLGARLARMIHGDDGPELLAWLLVEDSSLAGALARALAHGPGRSVQLAATRVRAHLASPDDIAWLVEEGVGALGEEDWRERERGAVSLGGLPTSGLPDALLDEVIEALQEASGDADADVRAAAERALRQLGGAR